MLGFSIKFVPYSVGCPPCWRGEDQEQRSPCHICQGRPHHICQEEGGGRQGWGGEGGRGGEGGACLQIFFHLPIQRRREGRLRHLIVAWIYIWIDSRWIEFNWGCRFWTLRTGLSQMSLLRKVFTYCWWKITVWGWMISFWDFCQFDRVLLAMSSQKKPKGKVQKNVTCYSSTKSAWMRLATIDKKRVNQHILE